MPLITAPYLFWVSLPRPHPCWHSGAKLGNHNEDPSLSPPFRSSVRLTRATTGRQHTLTRDRHQPSCQHHHHRKGCLKDAFLVLHRPQVYQDLLNPILNDFWKWVGGRSHCHFTWRWYFHWVWMVELHKLYQRFEQMFYCFGKLLGCSESVSSLPGSLDSDISQSWPWGRNDTNTHQNYELN